MIIVIIIDIIIIIDTYECVYTINGRCVYLYKFVGMN